jgi:hypothetical protein
MVSNGGLIRMAIDDPIGGSDWNPKDRLDNDLEIPNSDRYHVDAIDGFGSIECLSIDHPRRSLLPAAAIVAIDRSCVAYSISHHHRRFPMNFETCHIDDFPTIGATELDVSSGGSSSVDETSGETTTQTWVVYNGNSNTPYAEFNGSGTLLERYLAGPSYVPGVTGMIARTNASVVTDWYLTGKLGSVRDIVNMSGTVIDHISYGAFGSIRAENNARSDLLRSERKL